MGKETTPSSDSSRGLQLSLLPTEVAAALHWRRRSEELLRAWGHFALKPEEEEARDRQTLAVVELLGAKRCRTGSARAARLAWCGAPVLAEVREPVEGPPTREGQRPTAPSSLLGGVTWTRLACRDRWCPRCQRARAEELLPRVAGWLESRVESGASLALLTLTRPRRGSSRQAVDQVLGAWDRLSRSRPWRFVRGYLRALEVVARRDGELVRHRGVEVRARGTGPHAHLHALVEVDLAGAAEQVCELALPWFAGLRDLARDSSLAACPAHARERPGLAPGNPGPWRTFGAPACDPQRPCDRGRWARSVARAQWWADLREAWLGQVEGASAGAQDLRWLPERPSQEELVRQARELGAYALDGLAGLVDDAARDPWRRRYASEVLQALDGRRTLATGGLWAARRGGLDLRPQPRLRGVALAPQPLALVAATEVALWLDGRRSRGREARAALAAAAAGPRGGLRERVFGLLTGA